MKFKLLPFLLGLAIISAAPVSQAQVGISIGVNTCGYPSYNSYCPGYAPPVGVYFGGGTWGNDRRYRDDDHRDHDNHRDHDDHHNHGHDKGHGNDRGHDDDHGHR